MARFRVLIVDDTTLVRQALGSLLERQESVECVGEAATVHEAAAMAAALSPHVVLIDQDTQGFDIYQAVRLLKHRAPSAEVVVLGDEPDDERAFRALEAGACGYVLKDIQVDTLVRAIEGVCNGRTLMHPRVTRRLVERFRALMRERQDGGVRSPAGLTDREIEILAHMTHGATDQEIARRMYLSPTTVKSHIRSIFRKTGTRNRTQAVVYMLQSGWRPRPRGSFGHGQPTGGARPDEGDGER